MPRRSDGFGIWRAARRLHTLSINLIQHQGRFLWSAISTERGVALTRLQFDALIVGLPWARLEEMQRIAYV